MNQNSGKCILTHNRQQRASTPKGAGFCYSVGSVAGTVQDSGGIPLLFFLVLYNIAGLAIKQTANCFNRFP
jgi:hypothetical protein